jgi:hypothetical protein
MVLLSSKFRTVALGAEVPGIDFLHPIIAESVPFCTIYSFQREAMIEFGNTVAANHSIANFSWFSGDDSSKKRL